jgi:HK97 family phage major capsid protein
MDSKELREKRARLIAQARQLLETAEGETRDLSQEEQTQWDELMNKADELLKRAERIERQQALDRDLEQRQGADPIHTQGNPEQCAGEPNEAERRMTSFRRLLPLWISGDYRALPVPELRALQADLDVSGGYLRPPEQFIEELIKAIDDVAYIRQWATTFTVTNAESMGVPTLENDPADSNWTSELATGSEDSTMAFGKRALHPHPLAKRIKVSRKLIRAVPSAEGLVRDRLAYKFGITFEKACLTGTGAGEPLGVLVASDDGISTDRDVSTGNTTTEIRFDGLIEAKYTLKPGYWPRARWLFHRDGVKQIAKLKDGEGQYIWSGSVREGEPDRILGLPAFMSEYVSNTFTAGLYVGILGDFSNYWIADALTLEFQLLNELYAETGQVGLIGRLESDSMPVLEEAFVRVKLST